MIRPVRKIAAHAPCGNAKHEHKEKKEPTRNFQKQDAAHAAERSQESAYAARHTPAHTPSGGACLPGAHCRLLLRRCNGIRGRGRVAS